MADMDDSLDNSPFGIVAGNQKALRLSPLIIGTLAISLASICSAVPVVSNLKFSASQLALGIAGMRPLQVGAVAAASSERPPSVPHTLFYLLHLSFCMARRGGLTNARRSHRSNPFSCKFRGLLCNFFNDLINIIDANAGNGEHHFSLVPYIEHSSG